MRESSRLRLRGRRLGVCPRQKHGLSAQVSQVGCLGLCFAEPLVDVQFPGGPRVFYGNVTPGVAEQIVASHVAKGTPEDDLALGYLSNGAGSILKKRTLFPGIPDLDQHPMRASETRIVLRNAGNIDPLDIYQYVANGGYRGSPEGADRNDSGRSIGRR